MLSGKGASARWLRAFLEDFEEVASAGEADIELEIAEGVSRELPTGALLFATDRFRAHRSEKGISLTNGRSWVTVEPGPSIRGEVASDESDPELEILFVALLIALRELRVFELHAAAVCRDDTALLLVGPSGSGKSSTALSLLTAGCDCLGDDRLLFRDRDGEIELLHYPVAFRATPETLASFPALSRFASPDDYLGKHPLDIEQAFPGRVRRDFRGHTLLLFPEFGERSELREIAPQSAFERLLLESGSLALESHSAPREHLDLLRRLVQRSRRLSLTLGPEWLSAPERAARALLDDLFGARA